MIALPSEITLNDCFGLLVLRHAGLWCDSMAEHLPSVSQALSPTPGTIGPIIQCGQWGVVVQTCDPVLRHCCGPGLKVG